MMMKNVASKSNLALDTSKLISHFLFTKESPLKKTPKIAKIGDKGVMHR